MKEPLLQSSNDSKSELKTEAPHHSLYASASFHKQTYVTFFLLGLGYLFPFFSFITVVDYFNLKYKTVINLSVDFLLAVAYNLGSLVIYFFLKWISKIAGFTTRIYFGFFVYFIICFTVPFVNEATPDSFLHIAFWLTIISVFIVGLMDGLLNEAVFEFTSIFPEPIYTQSVMMGIGFASVIVVVWRVITKLLMSIQLSVYSSFWLAAFLTISCIVGTFFVVKSDFVKQYLLKNTDKGDIEQNDTRKLKECEDIGYEKAEVSIRELWEVSRRLKYLPITIFFTEFVSLVVYPGMATNGRSSLHISDDWFPVIVISTWTAGDFLGRVLPVYFSLFTAVNIVFPLIIRSVVMLPLFIGIAWVPAMDNDLLLFFLLLFSGLSHGYLSTAAMMLTSSVVDDPPTLKKANIVMGFLMIFGLAMGSFCSILIGFLLPSHK